MKCRCGCGNDVKPKFRSKGRRSTSTFYSADCRSRFQASCMEAFNRRDQQEFDVTPRTAFDEWLYRYRPGYIGPMVYGA